MKVQKTNFSKNWIKITEIITYLQNNSLTIEHISEAFELISKNIDEEEITSIKDFSDNQYLSYSLNFLLQWTLNQYEFYYKIKKLINSFSFEHRNTNYYTQTISFLERIKEKNDLITNELRSLRNLNLQTEMKIMILNNIINHLTDNKNYINDIIGLINVVKNEAEDLKQKQQIFMHNGLISILSGLALYYFTKNTNNLILASVQGCSYLITYFNSYQCDQIIINYNLVARNLMLKKLRLESLILNLYIH